ncbi:MAG TPA: methyltransferase [Mycobacterium sp.]|uniref:methyltransferase n=1 Tax=Mycobacterium sp. TaxID=1785 RepID=UPI002F4096DC
MVFDTDADSYSEVYRLIMAAWGTQAVRCLAGLSVAEHLETESLSAQEIAERESVDPGMLYRLLRAGVAMGLIDYNSSDQTFSTTSMLRVLHRDAPESLKSYAQAAVGPAFWLPAARAPQAIARGQNQVVEALGTSVFEYYAEHPDEARMFSAAMTDVSTPVIREAVSVIDVGAARYAVDVGGANGVFVSELVDRNPQLTGAVLDLPHVIPGVVQEVQRRGLTQRVTGIAGNFFESVPNADIFLLKFILHDWDDRSCITLLGNVRRAMNPGGRLFIVEMVVAPDRATIDAALMDMGMLFFFSGQERDISQFDALLQQAGLRVSRVKSLRGSYRIIEAVAHSPGQGRN